MGNRGVLLQKAKMKKLRIALVWYWPRASEIFVNWRDGLKAALEIIGKKHEIKWFLDQGLPKIYDDYDFVLFWGDSNLPPLNILPFNAKCKYGICLSSDNALNINNLKKMNVVFAESWPIYQVIRLHGIRTIKAFGTDIEFYSPDPMVKKDIEYFYPATFSPWKRQADIAYLGPNLLCVGTVQPDGVTQMQVCLENGVKVEEGYFPAEKIRDYYQRAKHVIIPAVHGSERTVLEAMACDILPQVTNSENVKASSYIKEYYLSNAKSPRDFILRNYSHKKYAASLLKGMEENA